MIREARKDDKSEVYDLWKHAYPNQNRNYLNFYFKKLFDKGTCLILQQDNRIVSSLQLNTHVLVFHGKRLNAGYILGVSTLPDYRRRGHMQKLMESAIDEANHNQLITLIKAFNPKLYERYGFETIYYHKQYLIHREYLKKVTNGNVSNIAEPEELLEVYRIFLKHFDGAYYRDIEYYSLLLDELTINQKNMLVYRDKSGELLGYLIYQRKKDDIVVKEIIYLESIVLMHLLKAAIGTESDIIVEVSQNEKLEKLFPMAVPKKQAVMMARINNYELFNKLYNTNVKTVHEAFGILQKPLWNHEYY